MQEQRLPIRGTILVPILLATALIATALIGTAWSQSFTAAMRGTVTDASGSSVPGAKVIATEADRNVPHHTTTDASGRYFLPALQPRQYNLTVEAAGFKKFAQRSFQLQVQQQATLDVKLEVGELSSTVTVEGSAPLLNTTIASLGQAIDNKYYDFVAKHWPRLSSSGVPHSGSSGVCWGTRCDQYEFCS